jgi:hypothetical protein
MNIGLLKALIALAPTCALLVGAMVRLANRKSPWAFVQVIGAACLVGVTLTHVSEALHLFQWMHWGAENSVGHYLDLSCAVLGLILFPTGYVLDALPRRGA